MGEHIIRLTVTSSSYNSFGPCHGSRTTISCLNGEFMWGTKTQSGKSAMDALGIMVHMRDDSDIVFVPVSTPLQSEVRSLFKQLVLSCSGLQEQCCGINDRFPTSPSSLEIELECSDHTFRVETTLNPDPRTPLPPAILNIMRVIKML